MTLTQSLGPITMRSWVDVLDVATALKKAKNDEGMRELYKDILPFGIEKPFADVNDTQHVHWGPLVNKVTVTIQRMIATDVEFPKNFPSLPLEWLAGSDDQGTGDPPQDPDRADDKPTGTKTAPADNNQQAPSDTDQHPYPLEWDGVANMSKAVHGLENDMQRIQDLVTVELAKSNGRTDITWEQVQQRVEAAVTAQFGKVPDLNEMIAKTGRELKILIGKLSEEVQATKTAVAGIDTRVKTTESNIETMSTNVRELSTTVRTGFEEQTGRMDGFDQRLGNAEQKVTGVNNSQGDLTQQIEELRNQLAAVKAQSATASATPTAGKVEVHYHFGSVNDNGNGGSGMAAKSKGKYDYTNAVILDWAKDTSDRDLLRKVCTKYGVATADAETTTVIKGNLRKEVLKHKLTETSPYHGGGIPGGTKLVKDDEADNDKRKHVVTTDRPRGFIGAIVSKWNER